MSERAHPVRELVAVLTGFTVLAILWTAPLVFRLAHGLPELGDSLLNTWILAWGADRLRHGLVGLWDAPIFFPFTGTFAFSEHLLGVLPFVAPIEWISGNPLLAYNVALLLSYVLAGAGAYLLARALTRSRAAGLAAGVIFMTTPYRASQIAHLQVLMSGWMLVGLWGLHRYLETGRRRMLGAFVGAFALQGLSNGYFLYFESLPAAMVVLGHLARRSSNRARTLRDLAVAGGALVAVFVPIALAYYGARRVHGFTRTCGEVAAYAADVGSYLYAGGRSWAWSWLPGVVRPEAALFPGGTVLLLALVGAWSAVRRPAGRRGATIALYGAIALVAFVLSLGPEPTAWGATLGPVGPYGWLRAVIPGFDGLRVPSRLGVVVILGLTVMAAFGVEHLLRRRAPATRAWLLALVIAGAAVDGWAGPMPFATFRPSLDESHVSSWLRTRPPGAVLYLPFGVAGRGAIATLRAQYETLSHGHPIVNGSSGFRPALQGVLEEEPTLLSDPTLAARVVDALRGIGVRYLVIRRADYQQRTDAIAIERAVRARTGAIADAYSFADTVALDLGTLPPAPASSLGTYRRVSAAAMKLRASRNDAVIGRATDGDPSTRWYSRLPQDGREWIEVRFDRSRDVARVRLQHVPGYAGDYPHRLRVELSEDGQRFEPVIEEEPIESLIASLAREPRRGAVEIDLPTNRTRALRLRQTGQSLTWSWAVNELEVWERE